ncbi:hypothetical protein DFJ73DRAFT_906822 [Zopfochytrium polystomum]|nr:hypothetical protein DFJ73DRAFT_906822 [Zopfochytrium polystomum]
MRLNDCEVEWWDDALLRLADAALPAAAARLWLVIESLDWMLQHTAMTGNAASSRLLWSAVKGNEATLAILLKAGISYLAVFWMLILLAAVNKKFIKPVVLELEHEAWKNMSFFDQCLWKPQVKQETSAWSGIVNQLMPAVESISPERLHLMFKSAPSTHEDLNLVLITAEGNFDIRMVQALIERGPEPLFHRLQRLIFNFDTEGILGTAAICAVVGGLALLSSNITTIATTLTNSSIMAYFIERPYTPIRRATGSARFCHSDSLILLASSKQIYKCFILVHTTKPQPRWGTQENAPKAIRCTNSEPVWDYGYRDPQITGTTTAAADYSVKRARPQQDHFRVVRGRRGSRPVPELSGPGVVFKRRAKVAGGGGTAAGEGGGGGGAVAAGAKGRRREEESIRLTSTHKKHFATGGLVVDSSLSAAAAGKPAGLPTPKSEALFTVASSTLLDTIKAAQRR